MTDAAQIREALAAECPEFLAFADLARERFGARLGSVEVGGIKRTTEFSRVIARHIERFGVPTCVPYLTPEERSAAVKAAAEQARAAAQRKPSQFKRGELG